MPGPGERVRRVVAELRQGEHFAEKDFYLEEFRGRSVLVAVAPGVTDLGRLASALATPGSGAVARSSSRVLTNAATKLSHHGKEAGVFGGPARS